MKFQISRELSARIQMHSMHVKMIYFCEFIPRLHYSALAYLNHAPGRPKLLFPRAEEVHVPAFADHAMEAVFYPVLALGTSMRKVTVFVQEVFATYNDSGLEAEPEGAQWTALAHRLIELAPNLTSFDILQSDHAKCDAYENNPGPAGTIGFKPTFHQLFISLGCTLQSLDIALLGLSANSISFLGQLQRLHTLKIRIGLSTREGFFNVPATASRITLPASPTSPSSPIPLKQVEMDGGVYPRDLLSPLQQTGSHSTLSSISIYEVKPVFDVDEQSWWERVISDSIYAWFEVDDQDLQVLSAFHRLSSLSISPCKTHGVGDEALRSLVLGCPDLQRLQLRDDTMRPILPVLTFRGVQIAQQMEELALRFDATTQAPNLPPSTDAPGLMNTGARLNEGGPHSNNHSSVGDTLECTNPSYLRSLDVCTSPLSSSGLFKTWLAFCHPLVKDIHYFKALWEGMPPVD
ncbi:hypothetical protein BKA70DRAFT_1565085 [Coprinopsis sp. MPI-PUGE-AT-0042]|nr:hypothetical protein BKA70DRAFT_1565085 [Coprinopsis sp. MPI-PUGE-AT-0042]